MIIFFFKTSVLLFILIKYHLQTFRKCTFLRRRYILFNGILENSFRFIYQLALLAQAMESVMLNYIFSLPAPS